MLSVFNVFCRPALAALDKTAAAGLGSFCAASFAKIYKERSGHWPAVNRQCNESISVFYCAEVLFCAIRRSGARRAYTGGHLTGKAAG